MRMIGIEVAQGGLTLAADHGDRVELAPGLALNGIRMRFERNAEIFGAEEDADFIYVVRSGAVRTLSFSSDGRRQVMGFHLPGDVFGFEFGDKHGFSAEAIAPSDIVMIRRRALDKQAAQDAAAAFALLHLTSRQLQAARECALLLGKKGAEERVAGFLLSLSQRQGGANLIELAMSRADIADYLGLTIETISRTLTLMERRGDIGLPSSRKVAVKSRCTLEMLEAA